MATTEQRLSAIEDVLGDLGLLRRAGRGEATLDEIEAAAARHPEGAAIALTAQEQAVTSGRQSRAATATGDSPGRFIG